MLDNDPCRWPTTYVAAESLYERLLDDQIGQGADLQNSVGLTTHLLGFLGSRLPFGTQSTPALLAKRTLGRDVATRLGVTPSVFDVVGSGALFAIRKLNRLIGETTDQSRRLSALWGRLGIRIIDEFSNLEPRKEAGLFSIPMDFSDPTDEKARSVRETVPPLEWTQLPSVDPPLSRPPATTAGSEGDS